MAIFQLAPGAVVSWRGMDYHPNPNTGELLVTHASLVEKLSQQGVPRKDAAPIEPEPKLSRKENDHAEDVQRGARAGQVDPEGEGERRGGWTFLRQAPGAEQGQGRGASRSEPVQQVVPSEEGAALPPPPVQPSRSKRKPVADRPKRPKRK